MYSHLVFTICFWYLLIGQRYVHTHTFLHNIILYPFIFCVELVNFKKPLDDIHDIEVRNSELNIRSKDKRIAINRLRKNRIPGTQDLPPPYPNGWYGVLESTSLKAGESVYLSCLGQHFVVYRTESNNVFVLDAYCPHLGANLGIGGRVVGDNIECPFHRWSFRGTDGKCTSIPYSTCG